MQTLTTMAGSPLPGQLTLLRCKVQGKWDCSLVHIHGGGLETLVEYLEPVSFGKPSTPY